MGSAPRIEADAVLFKPTHRVARSLEYEHRHALASRGADRRESAGWRDHQLLPEVEAVFGPVTLEITTPTDAWCAAIRAADSGHADPRAAGRASAALLVRPPQTLSTEPGLHRFIWDVHYQPLPEAATGQGGGRGGRGGLPIQAVAGTLGAGTVDAVGDRRDATR